MGEQTPEPEPESSPNPIPPTDHSRWEADYRAQLGAEPPRSNRSGITVKPLYTPDDWDSSQHDEQLGSPGSSPMTRGVYSTMHRGRPWRPRLLVGLGLPEDYNQRMRSLLDTGGASLYLAPCNSHLRGFDGDAVERELLGTCGTLIGSTEDMSMALDGLPIDREAISMGDTAPYTLSAFMLKVARDRGIPWNTLAGTTNQSDYLSHFAALHMFFRVALPGQRRLLVDHIEWMNREVPRWNPISVVGQHMQQAGATPAQAMGLAISSALQYADDLVARGHEPDSFLPRFSFFFDISISFFEEVAKFRAGRRIWNRVTGERFGAADLRSRRFRFHGQTSGVDLTRQQPLNNVARVAVQAMAGIFGGLQSLHTDSYDEALSTPTEAAAQIAIATQNILRHEAHLDDVIDPLGGSYYVEALTDEMEAEIEGVIAQVDSEGGMYAAVESGFVQNLIGESARAWQDQIESEEEIIVGVNGFIGTDGPSHRPQALERPDPVRIDAYLERLARFRKSRDQGRTSGALDDLARVCASADENVYAKVVDAALADATNGEICATVRAEMGEGQPLVVV